ncbi:DUF3524 domain-containing protein [bacterium]|nr:DUF3524 domain-containing protein [bacterium]
MKILALEAFYTGSHKVFIDTFVKHSRHQIDLKTMAGRFFKWRTRGASYHFMGQVKDLESYDLIFCGSMMSVADFRAFFRPRLDQKIVSYFHETQFSYPLKEGEKFDIQYGLNDVSTAMASDYCIFNSLYHQRQFLNDVQKNLKKMPDFQPLWIVENIANKSQVIYPCSEIIKNEDTPQVQDKLRVLYNHRWEHDKNPEEFFQCLFRLSDENYEFDLYVLGESYKNTPKIFELAKQKLHRHIRQFSYVESSDEYQKILKLCDLVVSTSIQENYGISVVEAMSNGCMALLPKRLSYPELLPKNLRRQFIYQDLYPSFKKIFDLNIDEKLDYCSQFSIAMNKFSTKKLVNQLDDFFETIVSKQDK